jgi:hypothetical protein
MRAFAKHPEVIYTELEDGAVLLHLDSGFYYSLDRVGLEIWRQVNAGVPIEAIAPALTQRFEVGQETAAAAIDAFVDQLVRERVIAPHDPAAAAAPAAPTAAAPATSPRTPFQAPTIVKHDEPLHQVSTHPFDPQLPLAE